MKKKKVAEQSLTVEEARLLEQLRNNPKIKGQVQEILDLVSAHKGELKTADQVEDLLVEQMRRLGNATMGQWAIDAEKRVSAELKQADPTVLSRKKKR